MGKKYRLLGMVSSLKFLSSSAQEIINLGVEDEDSEKLRVAMSYLMR